MKVNGYWVYEITTPDGMKYVGMSCRKYTSHRWRRNNYKTTALQSYIEEFGWDALKEEVIKDGLSKEEALQLEDELIRVYKEEGHCINYKCSGGVCCDENMKGYKKQYYDEHKEEILEQKKQYYDAHKEQRQEYQRKRYARQKELRLRTELNYDTLW